MRIADGRNMNRDHRVEDFNTLLKKEDDRLYCAFDYNDGFFKVYKDLPEKLWGAGGDFTGELTEGFYLFTIKTLDGQARPPHKSDLWTLRLMTPKEAPYSARKGSWWKKYQV